MRVVKVMVVYNVLVMVVVVTVKLVLAAAVDATVKTTVMIRQPFG